MPELADVASPTMRVGGAVLAELPNRAHALRMYSLDNGFAVDDCMRLWKNCNVPCPRPPKKHFGWNLKWMAWLWSWFTKTANLPMP